MRSRFDEQLALLNSELITMGSLCEEAITVISMSLSDGNAEFSQKVELLNNEIDRMERDIESLCLKLILQQQPVAKDLRQISAALKMVTDMERIGDQAEDIAEIISKSDGRIPPKYVRIQEMELATVKMVSDSINAYVKKDMDLARSVIEYDDVVDDCFCNVKKDLISAVAANPNDGEYALDLLMVAKYFERIGDHAVNIAEWVQFSITGHHMDIIMGKDGLK